jgi:hypothetical protein
VYLLGSALIFAGLGLITFWGGNSTLLWVGWGLFLAAIPVGWYLWVVMFRAFRSTQEPESSRSDSDS